MLQRRRRGSILVGRNKGECFRRSEDMKMAITSFGWWSKVRLLGVWVRRIAIRHRALLANRQALLKLEVISIRSPAADSFVAAWPAPAGSRHRLDAPRSYSDWR